jgi:hypothetical protein
MIRIFLLIWVFLLSPSSQAGVAQTPSTAKSQSQSEEWTEFSFPNGQFVVSMPAKPKSQSIPLDSIPGGLVANILGLDKEGESYAVAYVEFPNRVDDQTKSKAVLDGIVEKELAKIAGQLINQTDVALSGFSGREVRIEVVDGFWVDRFYLVGSRIYFVSAFVAKIRADTKEITERQNALIRKYFDSFKLKT